MTFLWDCGGLRGTDGKSSEILERTGGPHTESEAAGGAPGGGDRVRLVCHPEPGRLASANWGEGSASSFLALVTRSRKGGGGLTYNRIRGSYA